MDMTPETDSPVLRVVRKMRADAQAGRNMRSDWDDREGREQITIAATILLGRQVVSYDEAWSVMAEVAETPVTPNSGGGRAPGMAGRHRLR